MPFDRFLHYAIETNVDAILETQFDKISDNGVIIIDHVLRFENLNEEALEYFNVELKKHNASKNRPRYQDVYDDKTRKMVKKIFEEDLDIFKYTYEWDY